MSISTTDLCDAHEGTGKVVVVTPMLRHYGGKKQFGGQIEILKIFEDNQLVREAVAQNGEGKVLIIDGGGSLRSALVGDLLAKKAMDNGWAGIVVYGCIRDSVAIGELDLGVMALNTNPLRSSKKGEGSINIPVTWGGVTFKPNAYLYADEDGVIVSDGALM
jgi:regulator of ribonuclease activity A